MDVMPAKVRTTASYRRIRRARVVEFADGQEGVASRAQLYRMGLTRGEIRAEMKAGRWRPVGRHVVLTRPGQLTQPAALWAAQLSGGPRAQLDGEASLLAAGLTGYHVARLRVSVPRGARTFSDGNIDIRQTRRWHADDLGGAGVPRTRPEVAAIRAALWAVSDRQAALVLAMTVQQRLSTPERLAEAFERVRRAPRRALIASLLRDIAGGSHSVPELDFVAECRLRHLPEPTRQAVRQGPNGRWYLDAEWKKYGVIVEIDGIHHVGVAAVVSDALRHNELALTGAIVLRLPALGLRQDPDRFFGQIAKALVAGGWTGDVA